MRQAIEAGNRAEMVKRVVETYRDLVLRSNTQKIQINAGDTGLSLSAVLIFVQSPRSGAVGVGPTEYVDAGRLDAIRRLVDEHCLEINRARTIQIDLGFGDGQVTYDSSQVIRNKGSAAV